jgi:predicted nucleic acid-binding protein
MPAPRIAFADSNWLVATYHQTRDTAEVQSWAQRGPSTMIVSGPVLAECQCNFWRLGDSWPSLASDVRAGRWVDCGQSFETLAGSAADLFRRYASRCNVGTLDLLHIAAARHFGCRWFLSFDSSSGCRAVAHHCGLGLFPELSAEDRVWLRKFGKPAER